MCKLQQKSIRLNDIWLTVYLAILLVHLVLSLVFPLPQNDERTAIDVVLRTAFAALSGYFLSGAFVEKNPFPEAEIPLKRKLFYQNTVVAVLGLFSLSFMLASRYSAKLDFSVGTLSQIRDNTSLPLLF